MSALGRLWSLRRERPVFVAVSAFVLAYFLAYPAIDWWLRSIGAAGGFKFWDFGAYGGAVDRWLEGGEIYRESESGGYHGGFLYPPITLPLFWLFTEIPSVVSIRGVPDFRIVRVSWDVFSVFVLWVGLQLAIDALGQRLAIPERGLLLWAILGFQPLLLSVKMAQTAPLLAGFLSLSLATLLRDGRGRQLASGAFTGLVGVVKLSYAPVGAHLLLDRDRFLGALLTGLLALLASVVVFGVEIHVTYLDILVWGIEHGDSARSPALWAAPYYRPLFWIPGSVVLRVGAALLVAVAALLSPPDARRAVFALGVAAFPLFTPRTYTYYFVALLPAFLALLAVEFDRDGYPTVPVVALLVVSLHSHGLQLLVDVLVPPPTFEFLAPLIAPKVLYALLQPGLWGNALFVALAAYRVAGVVEAPSRPDLRSLFAG